VEIRVEGSYPELLAYLQALEALPHKLLWGSLQLHVEQHPRAVLTLRVYTLSPQAGWVEL
jgi:MSHA biogenesis protein MshJ